MGAAVGVLLHSEEIPAGTVVVWFQLWRRDVDGSIVQEPEMGLRLLDLLWVEAGDRCVVVARCRAAERGRGGADLLW